MSYLARLLCACLALAFSGCGSPFVSADGRVTFDGESVQDGTISFESFDGQGPSSGGSVANGQYRIERITPGKKIVRIKADGKSGKQIPLSSKFPPGMVKSNEMVDEIVQFIPAKYNSESELTVEIGSSATHQDFDLKSK